MNTKSQMSNTGFMPYNVAMRLLTSKQAMASPFRKRCIRATERVCEPVSRSTALPVSAPRTGEQRLAARLRKANAKQLHAWTKRTLARGNRYQDQRDNVFFDMGLDADEKEKLTAFLDQQIAAHNGLIDAINAELTSRAARGKGYKKPIKWSGVNPPPLAARDSEGGNTGL